MNRQKVLSFIVIVIFFSLIFASLFSLSMHKVLNNDEHQFIASAKLLESKSLLPYKDYPYFHLPNLIFIYGALFNYSEHLLFTARLFSVLCATATLATIFFVAYGLFARQNYLIRFVFGICSVMLILANPLFTYTTGYSWNHDSSTLFALLGFVVHCYAVRQERAGKWFLLSGIFLGLAIGTRLSFGPSFIPFITAILIYPNTTKQRKGHFVFCFVLGVFLSLLPSIILFALAPKQFIFGNLGYARLNTMYRLEMGYVRAMTLGSKVKDLLDIFSEPGNLLLGFLFIYLVLGRGMMTWKERVLKHFEVTFTLILLPFILAGSLAPTPSFRQYFYAPIPFIIMAIFYKVSELQFQEQKRKNSLKLLVIAMTISCIYAIPKYWITGNMMTINNLFPMRIHNAGIEISAIVGKGRVLTVAPIFALEGGSSIYKEFATGAFAWRTASFLSRKERKEFGMICGDDLWDFLENKAPAGILVGFGREELERPFVNYAEKKRYKALTFDGITLWTSVNKSPDSLGELR
jgi:4-amino-4-deoxy-L-arabinose transferase-like glycosyltransferase